MDVQRVKKMEEYLNEITTANERLEQELANIDSLRDKMISLFSYYGSREWYEDVEGDLPEGVNAGVLSEDAVYDQITSVRDNAIRMLELATDIIKNRI
ncbi:MAG: DUF4298 domain-containing protein [Clostridia bacterium]|nr:DUF4298 domain-containing protein [Clostridia bacterium]